MNCKRTYVLVSAVISVVAPLPGAVANCLGASINELIFLAVIPVLLMGVVCIPMSLCMFVHALYFGQWKEAALLTMSLFFPFVTFLVVQAVNGPGFDGMMSV